MTGGSPASERERREGKAGADWAASWAGAREPGRGKGFLGRGMKEKKKRWVGLKEREKEK